MLRKEAEVEKKDPSKEKENAVFLCLCHGNVLRSQWAEYYLKLLGFNAISAALGDVSLQRYQGEVPLHILGFLRTVGFDEGALQGNLIKEVTEEMVASATYILIFCDPKFAEDYSFINLNDDRVHLMFVPDAFGNIDAYGFTVQQVTLQIDSFLQEILDDEKKEEHIVHNPPAYGGKFFDHAVSAIGWSED